MYSKDDSNATYCSEVEGLLKAGYQKISGCTEVIEMNECAAKTFTNINAVSNKPCKKMPVRRSQRLAEKFRKHNKYSEDNVNISNAELYKIYNVKNTVLRKYTPDIFSNLKSIEQEEVVCGETIDQQNCFKEFPSCANQVFQNILETSGVPLDLSMKSTVSTRKTPQKELKVTNTTVAFESRSVKTSDVRIDYFKESENSPLPHQNLKHGNKSKRYSKEVLCFLKNDSCDNKKSYKRSKKTFHPLNKYSPSGSGKRKKQSNALSKDSTKIANLPNFPKKSESCFKVVTKKPIKISDISEDVNCSKNNISNNKDSCKRAIKSLQENLLCISEKRMKHPNKNLAKVSKDKEMHIKKLKRSENYSVEENIKHIPDLPTKYFGNENSENAQVETPALTEYVNHSDDISSDNKNAYRVTNKSFQVLRKHSTLISKHNNDVKKLNIQTKLNVTNRGIQNCQILSQNNAKVVGLNGPETKSESETRTNHISATYFNKMQERNGHLDENLLKTNAQSGELRQNIKLEQFISSELNETLTGTFAPENNFVIKTTPKTLQNTSQTKNETSISGQCTYSKSSNGDKFNKAFRSGTNANNTKLFSDNSEYQNCKLKSGCIKIKTEIFNQNSSKEQIQATKSKKNYPTKKIKKLPGQRGNIENELYSIELQGLVQNTESNLKPTTQTTSSCKVQNLSNYIKETKRSNASINVSKKTTLNKNYIKSFDRSQFLDKIQNTKDYIDEMSVQNNNYCKPTKFEIPLTPSETSQDLLKKAILPTICSLDIIPHSTCIVTPDDTISLELLDSSSSSPSLPESLCEHFQTKDVKDILNVERTSYRLYSYHIQALALILNMRLEYLQKVLEKIVNINPNVLKNIDKAVKVPFVRDKDIFSSSPVELWASGDVVLNSKSPKQRIMYKVNKQIQS